MKLLSKDDIDRSIGDVPIGGCLDMDLSRLFKLTGRMFSNPRPASMVGRSSSGPLDLDAMMGGWFTCS